MDRTGTSICMNRHQKGGDNKYKATSPARLTGQQHKVCITVIFCSLLIYVPINSLHWTIRVLPGITLCSVSGAPDHGILAFLCAIWNLRQNSCRDTACMCFLKNPNYSTWSYLHPTIFPFLMFFSGSFLLETFIQVYSMF